MKLFHDEHARLEVEMKAEGFLYEPPQAGPCGGGENSPAVSDQSSSESISKQGDTSSYKDTEEKEKKENKL